MHHLTATTTMASTTTAAARPIGPTDLARESAGVRCEASNATNASAKGEGVAPSSTSAPGLDGGEVDTWCRCSARAVHRTRGGVAGSGPFARKRSVRSPANEGGSVLLPPNKARWCVVNCQGGGSALPPAKEARRSN